MLARYVDKPADQLAALAETAERLITLHGSWKIPYGQLFRIQGGLNGVGHRRFTRGPILTGRGAEILPDLA